MAEPNKFDELSGTETTGHEWDGIQELNKPLPKWWVYVFYITIIWTVGYCIAYPAIPLISDYTKGVLGYSQRQTVMDEIAEARAAQGESNQAIATASVSEIKASPDLLQFAVAGGRVVFADNCAPCHGSGAQGGKGYPNLNDDDWIWGGTVDDIELTIRHGIRSDTAEERRNDMPRFGLDSMLDEGQINEVAEYVLSVSGNDHDAAAAGRGKAIFAENCAVCHGEDAKGNQPLGAPNLTDAIWLYGSDKADVVAQINTGGGGVMPAWSQRLDDSTIKKLTVYVHSLGGGL